MMGTYILHFQYGAVFGTAYIVACLTSPFASVIGSKIGPKALCSLSAIVQLVCVISYGFLDYVTDISLFLGLSYILR